jgi:aminopeptidase-like protein
MNNEAKKLDLCAEIDEYLKRLFPITRSITGPGNRETLQILQEIVPLNIIEYSSGTTVYDWVIPDEWRVREAWIRDDKGNVLIDFKVCNIHLVSYSEPVNGIFSFESLKPHLHTHEKIEDAIPYRTTYYKRDWGFCITQKQYEMLQATEGLFNVCIDSEFDSGGSLTVGELLIPGSSKQEILISTYNCHPSLANDNLSGTVLTAFLARELLKQNSAKFSYRIIWIPETIGAITYCAMNEAKMEKIRQCLLVSTVGGPGQFSYKQSFDYMDSINFVIEDVFKSNNIDFITYPFDIHGSDERQYSSQKFRINTATISKDKYYEYKYYHTSLDNLDYVKAQYINKSLQIYIQVLNKLQDEPVYKSNYPHCEVFLSKHGLYPDQGGAQLPNSNNVSELDVILWILWYCDGERGLYYIARKLKLSLDEVVLIAEKLANKNILVKVH